MKDYREDCRTQNSTNNVLFTDCQAALKKPLSPPPFSSSHIREKRLLQDHWSQGQESHLPSFPTSITPSFDTVMATAIMVTILSLVVVVFVGLGRAVGQTEDRRLRPIGLGLSHRMLDPAHEIIPAAWVATSVARRALSIFQGDDDNPGMRERKATKDLQRDDDSEHWGTVEMVYSNKYNHPGWNARAYATVDNFFADSDGEASWPIAADPVKVEETFSETDIWGLLTLSNPLSFRSDDGMDEDSSDASTAGIHMVRPEGGAQTMRWQDALIDIRPQQTRHVAGDVLQGGDRKADDALLPSSDAETQRAVIEEQFPEVSGSVAPHQRRNLVDATPTTPWFNTRPFLGDRVLLADPFYAKRPPSTPKVARKRQKEHSPSKQFQKAANDMDQKITFWSKTRAAMQGDGFTDNIIKAHSERSSSNIVQRESVEHRTSTLPLGRDVGSTQGNWLKRRSRRFRGV